MPRVVGERKKQILQALAAMLEQEPGGRITTAALAAAVGVSEAALYRHFPSKARMFEGLISYIEETLFTRISRIVAEPENCVTQCEQIMRLVLGFAEKNPGISRVLNGDALAGETARLRSRVAQIFDRLESQLKQILREAELREGLRTRVTVSNTAAVLLAYLEGRISQYIRSDFHQLPTQGWDEQWAMLQCGLLRQVQ